MSDHLPECPWADRGYAFPCICDRLRACEQRLTEGWCKAVCANSNYEAGLDAAREAVAAVGVRKDTSHDMRVQALAAIDALKEDR